MKKIIFTSIIVGASALALTACGASAGQKTEGTTVATTLTAAATDVAETVITEAQATSAGIAEANGAAITQDEAKRIALEKAGINEADATFTALKYEIDDGIPVWKVDFISNNIEYDFEINASTGDILEFESESVFE